MAGGFIQELKRRNVFRVGAAYLVFAWLLLQVIATVAPILDLPESLSKGTLVVLVIGFPVSLILAWLYELTPEGLKRDDDQLPPQREVSRKLNFLIIGVLTVAVIYFMVEKFVTTNPESGRKSVAVLPFDNLSGDDANQPFTSGIHDDLLTSISRIESIRTISKTSVLKYRGSTTPIPEIAEELGANAVVQGGVQRSGDRVRINARLIDAATDRHLWAETYDRELTAANVFAIQSEIATAIARQLQAALTSDDKRRLDKVPTRSIAALETYFVGKRMLEDRTIESLQAAIEYFDKVIELDPDFALAYSGLADAYMLIPEYSSTADPAMIKENSDAALKRARELDPDLAEVINSYAWSRLTRDYDWNGAEETFRKGLEIQSDNTNVLHWLAHTLSWQGRHEEAVELARAAHSIDPDSLLMQMNLAYILVDAGQFDEALTLGHDLKDREPHYYSVRRNLWLHELRAGRPEEAAEAFRSWAVVSNADSDAAEEVGQMLIDYAHNGTIGVLTPDLISRLKLGDEDLAQVLAFIGDREGTLAALEKAAEARTGSRSVLSMKINPGYHSIRDDPRFLTLLKKVGLSD